MKKENFTIEGPESLKKAFVEEVNTFHSTGKHCAAIHDGDYMDSYLCVYKEFLTITDQKESKHFKLPQDWDKAIQACKDFWKVEPKKSLYFGDVEFICDKEAKTAATSYGKVTLDQIENFIGYIENPPTIAGYSLTVHSLNSDNHTNLESLVQSDKATLGIGCKRGTLHELKTIANFLRG